MAEQRTRWQITPETFSGRKFQERYQLTREDYITTQERTGLFLQLTREISGFPDRPIFEPPDPPQKIVDTQLRAAARSETPVATTDRAMLAALTDELNILRAAFIPPFRPLTYEEMFARFDAKLTRSPE